MTETINTQTTTEPVKERTEDRSAGSYQKLAWETPQMEDVSEQVMAQPYIRFT